jgi:transcriptional regulator with XRE-family HTH domain
METIGILIKNAMTEAGIKQATLSASTGIDQHRISNILNDKHKSVNIQELESIAKSLNKNVVDLLPSSLVIQHNNYNESSSSVQNLHYTDPKLVRDLINQIVELKVELAKLKGPAATA